MRNLLIGLGCGALLGALLVFFIVPKSAPAQCLSLSNELDGYELASATCEEAHASQMACELNHTQGLCYAKYNQFLNTKCS